MQVPWQRQNPRGFIGIKIGVGAQNLAQTVTKLTPEQQMSGTLERFTYQFLYGMPPITKHALRLDIAEHGLRNDHAFQAIIYSNHDVTFA